MPRFLQQLIRRSVIESARADLAPPPPTTAAVTEARSRQSNFPQQLIPISYFGPMTFLDNGNVFCDIL